MSSSDDDSCDGSCGSCAGRSTCEDPRAHYETFESMGRIKHKIVVGSGKGGVGKSTVTVNLAAALKHSGYRVGILDADITGPNVPKLLGIEGQRLGAGSSGIVPANAGGIEVISMALLLESRDSAVVWRGPMKMAALKQFVSEVDWGELDFLLVDLPPGTGDEPISVVQLLPDLAGAIIVTTPQEVALLDSRKAINMFRMMGVSVMGIVENMSGLVCPHCGKVIDVFKRGGGKSAAQELGVDFLGALPMDCEIGRLGDQGQSFESLETKSGDAFRRIVSEIMKKIRVTEEVPA